MPATRASTHGTWTSCGPSGWCSTGRPTGGGRNGSQSSSTGRPSDRGVGSPPMWPPGALDFLRDLEDNNDRDWFKANRGRYDAHLLEPGRELAGRLTDLGEAHFFRPYND